MKDPRTIQAKECCCGCTLRTGTLILLWIILSIDCVTSLYYLTFLAYSKPYYTRSNKLVATYYFLWSVVGIMTSVLGIYGIQKNIPKYLTFIIYYIGYYAVHFCFCVILAIISPTTYLQFTWFSTSQMVHPSMMGELMIVIILSYAFCIALALYFVIIVKSYRDTASKSLAKNGTGDIPDPVALGYSVA